MAKNKISEDGLEKFIAERLIEYHSRIFETLCKLKLNVLLKKKNPYLFKAKNLDTAQDLIKSVLDAFLSSREETIFGGVLEEIAIFVCSNVSGGKKSSSEGIDLEFDKGGTHYIVSIKSGPNWGNSSQIKKMEDNFKKATRILGTNGKKKNVVAINGCCYGQDDCPHKGNYQKLCGQRFWEFISGDSELYRKIIQPLGKEAKTRKEDFLKEYAKIINKFTLEFIEKFCNQDGSIDWDRLVIFNSGKKDQ